jgi:hypothetical protein
MRVRGLVVMIVACQVMDPGSIPGERIFVLALTNQPPMCGTTETRQDIKIWFVRSRIPSMKPLVRAEYSTFAILHLLVWNSKEKKVSGQPESNQ